MFCGDILRKADVIDHSKYDTQYDQQYAGDSSQTVPYQQRAAGSDCAHTRSPKTAQRLKFHKKRT